MAMTPDSSVISGTVDLSGTDMIPLRATEMGRFPYENMLLNVPYNSPSPYFGSEVYQQMARLVSQAKGKDITVDDIKTIAVLLENVSKHGFDYLEKVAQVIEHNKGPFNFTKESSLELPLTQDITQLHSMESVDEFLRKAEEQRLQNIDPNLEKQRDLGYEEPAPSPFQFRP